MAIVLARHWWSLAIRGLLGVIFGVIAFLVPGAAITGVVLAFGVFALVTGGFALAFAIQAARAGERWATVLFEGIVGIVAGALTLSYPMMATLLFVTLIAVWALLSGAAQITAAIRLRRTIQNEWLWVLAGIASVAFGVILPHRSGRGCDRPRVVDRRLCVHIRHPADRAGVQAAQMEPQPH